MYSGPDTLERVGFPIRTSADQRSLASPRGFSQRATSFIASWRQGIHRTPLSRSISHHHRPHAGPNRAPRHEQTRNTKRLANTPANRATPISQATLTSNPSSLVKEHDGQTPSRRSGRTTVLEVPDTARRPHRTSALSRRHPQPHHGIPAPTLAGRSGGKRIRTDDPLLAKQVLYQLSYAPTDLAARTTSPAATKPPPQTRKP